MSQECSACKGKKICSFCEGGRQRNHLGSPECEQCDGTRVCRYCENSDEQKNKMYEIVVDYSLTLEEMIEAAQCIFYRSYLIPFFKLKGSEKKKLTAKIIQFNSKISSSDAKSVIKAMGFRAAKIEELLAFASAFPKVQEMFDIVALGSTCNFSGSKQVPFIANDYGRSMDLIWYGIKWVPEHRFLVVKEEV